MGLSSGIGKSSSSLIIPEDYNYIACFLTFRCNLQCSYCINNFGESIPRKRKEGRLIASEWIEGLNRIVSRPDLPVTLQGGEPLAHPGFVEIVNGIKKDIRIDILTNLYEKNFMDKLLQIDPKRIKRDAPYASIRVSYHPEQMKLDVLIKNILLLQGEGYSVGVWGVMHPAQEKEILRARDYCLSRGVDFRLKEFLGEYNGQIFGHSRYNGACDGRKPDVVQCKTTELIIGPDGSIYRCHSDLYEGRPSIGNILYSDFAIQNEFRSCDVFGCCNLCDVKVKTNRKQEFGHSSVEIAGENVQEISREELRMAAEECCMFNKKF